MSHWMCVCDRHSETLNSQSSQSKAWPNAFLACPGWWKTRSGRNAPLHSHRGQRWSHRQLDETATWTVSTCLGFTSRAKLLSRSPCYGFVECRSCNLFVQSIVSSHPCVTTGLNMCKLEPWEQRFRLLYLLISSSIYYQKISKIYMSIYTLTYTYTIVQHLSRISLFRITWTYMRLTQWPLWPLCWRRSKNTSDFLWYLELLLTRTDWNRKAIEHRKAEWITNISWYITVWIPTSLIEIRI